MSKYISEDILLEDLWDSKCESDILRKVRQAIVDEIIGIEGIDIVWCPECIHWQKDKSFCKQFTVGTPEDGYCYMGKTERSRR